MTNLSEKGLPTDRINKLNEKGRLIIGRLDERGGQYPSMTKSITGSCRVYVMTGSSKTRYGYRKVPVR